MDRSSLRKHIAERISTQPEGSAAFFHNLFFGIHGMREYEEYGAGRHDEIHQDKINRVRGRSLSPTPQHHDAGPHRAVHKAHRAVAG